MNKKNVAWGILLIMIAVYYLLSKLEIIPEEFSTSKVIFTVLFVLIALKGLLDHSFTAFVLSLGVIGCIHAELLHITKITTWPLLLASLLIGIGLDLIFKNVWKKNNSCHKIPPKFGDPYIENVMDGEQVNLENNFASISKYVNSNSFKYAKLENNFGKCNVYFNNAILGSTNAQIEAKNTFGEMNLYFPDTWRVDVRQDSAFGDIKFKGVGSTDPDSPCVFLNAQSQFGQINIYFE